jgi:tetratricopeptide (TPR) repeat protein
VIKKYIILICITFFFNNISFSKTVSDSKTTSEEPKDPIKMSDYNLAKKYIEKGDKYEKKNKKVKAKKYYNKALKYLLLSNKKHQPHSKTFNYLGYVNAKLGVPKDAEIYYLLGLEVDPKNNNIYVNLGNLYINSNRIMEAKEILNVLKNCNCEEFKELSNSIKLN